MALVAGDPDTAHEEARAAPIRWSDPAATIQHVGRQHLAPPGPCRAIAAAATSGGDCSAAGAGTAPACAAIGLAATAAVRTRHHLLLADW